MNYIKSFFCIIIILLAKYKSITPNINFNQHYKNFGYITNFLNLSADLEKILNLNKIDITNISKDEPKLKLNNSSNGLNFIKNININNISSLKLSKARKYLFDYYPKVFVTIEKYMFYMKPNDIAMLLSTIIELIADKPWFYIEAINKAIMSKLNNQQKKKWKNEKYNLNYIINLFGKNISKLEKYHGFELFIADQLSFFNNFIKKSIVDPDTHLVIYDDKKNSSAISLITFWENNGIEVHNDFYELCAEYWSRLFINSIKSKDLILARRYLKDLKTILKNLKNSKLEHSLFEYIEKYKGLLDILRSKIALNKVELDQEINGLIDQLNLL